MSAAAGPVAVAGVDHVGFTVADLDQAVAFLTGALGFEHVSAVGPVPDPALGEGVSHDVVVLAAPDGHPVEVVRYRGLGDAGTPPAQSSAGASHLALRVVDVAAVAAALVRDHGVRASGPATTVPGEPGPRGRRTTFQHLVTPWGFAVELISRGD